ncbi:MAG TPA: hypothetical protein VD948_12975 [Rhodothermales bacterium]|nr:hypothetical protein [Rhodothermales bacterium]
MGKKKSETKQTNTYGYFTPPSTPDTDTLRQADYTQSPSYKLAQENIERFKRGEDVTGFGFNAPLMAQHAAQRRDIMSGLDNPFSGITNPVLRQRLRESALSRAQEQAGTQLMQNTARVQDQMTGLLSQGDLTELQRKEALARITSPQLVQTGGTAQTTQSGGLLGSIIGGGLGIAGKFI